MYETEKAKRIIDELLTYLLSNEITEIQVGLEFTDEGFYVEVHGNIEVQPADLGYFSSMLSIPRDPNIEDSYDELLGDHHHEEDNYQLVGMMIDQAEIAYDAPILNIKVFRRNELHVA